MPDRFANGDEANDSVSGYYDSMQYEEKQNRYGGDIQGIINKLDYIKDFGATAIWSTPLLGKKTTERSTATSSGSSLLAAESYCRQSIRHCCCCVVV